ncbi:uncharacterized protein N7500_008270 [Penicillium coprophilum]|uniref:uncharacterized protein n=1 Tax=Penicillium coprophilum TaxID=36646 RepID=UPI00239DDAA9|nr:uncharacterized protein N7500_008270 [Penicillium coprophilum]KAJ5158619.1 hypothetical protein N7500_008270 [Penicillium coprophilum]
MKPAKRQYILEIPKLKAIVYPFAGTITFIRMRSIPCLNPPCSTVLAVNPNNEPYRLTISLFEDVSSHQKSKPQIRHRLKSKLNNNLTTLLPNIHPLVSRLSTPSLQPILPPSKPHTFLRQSDTFGQTTSIGHHSRHVSDHNVGISVPPCAVLRGRSSMVLRQRPSKTDLALSEERSRCHEDSIERQGLGLMEPRPVDLGVGEMTPKFVMGGIFEVMEGRA